jgi:cytochrome c oxidase assembly protein subunit 15
MVLTMVCIQFSLGTATLLEKRTDLARHAAKAQLPGIALLWLRARREDVAPAVRSGAMMVLAMACIQFGLGVVTLLEGVPIWVGTLHEAGAMLLLVTLMRTLCRAAPGL